MIHKKVYINTTLETKGVELDNQGGKILKIAGFANASTKDRGNEIITPEAWRKGIENYKKKQKVTNCCGKVMNDTNKSIAFGLSKDWRTRPTQVGSVPTTSAGVGNSFFSGLS